MNQRLDGLPETHEPVYAAERTSKLAIFGFILGVLGLILWILTSIPGIIVSAIAMSKTGKSGGRLGGHSLALAGLIISIIATVTGIFFFGIMAAMLAGPLMNARATALSTYSASNMKQIGTAIIMYKAEHEKAPEKLQDLMDAGYIDNIRSLQHPLSDDEGEGYILLPAVAEKRPGNRIILVEKPGLYAPQINVLFLDGSVLPFEIKGAEAQTAFVQALLNNDLEALRKIRKTLPPELDFYIDE